MPSYRSLARLTTSLALCSTLVLSSSLLPAHAQTASFVSAHSAAINGEISELSHVILIQIPRPVVLDVGAKESTTLTVPTLSEIVINGQTIAPAQTPVLITIESDGNQGARVRAKGIMLKGKLVALDAKGDLIPSFIVGRKEFNDRVKAAMNLGAMIGNGIAGSLGPTFLGPLGAAMGDPTGTNLALQMTSAGGLMGIMSGMFGGKGGKRIIDLQANSTHVLTLNNPAMVVAQLIQLNKEIATGNQGVINAVASRMQRQIPTTPSLAQQLPSTDRNSVQTAAPRPATTTSAPAVAALF